MACLEPFTPRHSGALQHLPCVVNAVNASGRPPFTIAFRAPVHHSLAIWERLVIGLPQLTRLSTGGRYVGAGAGATPVFVAAIRHDAFLARLARSWVAPAPAPTVFIANPKGTHIPKELFCARWWIWQSTSQKAREGASA
jgi:hypothetical protein